MWGKSPSTMETKPLVFPLRLYFCNPPSNLGDHVFKMGSGLQVLTHLLKWENPQTNEHTISKTNIGTIEQSFIQTIRKQTDASVASQAAWYRMENGPKSKNGKKLAKKNRKWPLARNGEKNGPNGEKMGFGVIGVIFLFFRQFWAAQGTECCCIRRRLWPLPLPSISKDHSSFMGHFSHKSLEKIASSMGLSPGTGARVPSTYICQVPDHMAL